MKPTHRSRTPMAGALLESLGLALGAGACALPYSSTSPTASSTAVATPIRKPAAERPLALPELVPVRIASVERAQRVRVGDTAAGTLELERAGELVRVSDGRLVRAVELEPGPGAPGLGLAERTYLGTLVVEPHGAGGLRVTNLARLEDYVAGVVAAELVLWSALPAEMEAQAVAARSYAARALEERGPGGFVWDDTRDQVYRGRFLPAPTARARSIEVGLERAVSATRGRVLVAGGRIVDARFHASCGGYTAEFRDVFRTAGDGAGLAPAPCPPCDGLAGSEALGPGAAPARVRWEWTAGSAELARLAESLRIGSTVTSLRPARVDDHGRWLAVELEGEWARRRIDFDELRHRLGHETLKGARVVRVWPRPGDPIRGGLYFEGRGRGHGVGLCQVGARERAAGGWSSTRILGHYYPGAELRSLPARTGALADARGPAPSR